METPNSKDHVVGSQTRQPTAAWSFRRAWRAVSRVVPLKAPSAPATPGCPEPPPEPVRSKGQGDHIAYGDAPQDPRYDICRHPDCIAPAVGARICPVRGGKIQEASPI